MNYVPIVVATDLEEHFSVLKKGVPILLYILCMYKSLVLVMSFWLKVCIYSHTRGVKLGLGLGFMQTSQVLPGSHYFFLCTEQFTQTCLHFCTQGSSSSENAKCTFIMYYYICLPIFAHILYFDEAKFSIKLVYFTVSVVRHGMNMK